MKILIDTITPIGAIVAFDDNKIIAQKEIRILGKEFNDFLDVLLGFLDEYNIEMKDIGVIVVVNGPGGFTGTRIIALIMNTINFVHGIKLESIDYFSLLEKLDFTYPMLIKANKSEYLCKDESGSSPFIVNKDDISQGVYSGIGETSDFENKNISIKMVHGYTHLIENFDFYGDSSRVEPFYIKKPNIT